MSLKSLVLQAQSQVSRAGTVTLITTTSTTNQSSLLPPLSLSLPLSPPPLSSLEESLDELESSDELKLSDEQLELELSVGVELSDEQFELELSLLNRLAMLEPLLPPPLLEP